MFDFERARLLEGANFSRTKWYVVMEDELAIRVHGISSLPMGIEREESRDVSE